MSKIRASNLSPDNIVSWFAVNGSGQLNDVQKALILAKLGVRPKTKINKQDAIVITWLYCQDRQLTGDIMRQIASIIKSHKEMTKTELIKICETKLDCRGTIYNSVTNCIKVLKHRGIVKVKYS